MPTDVSVVIVTYNSAQAIGSTLDSLAALPGPERPLQIIVVDNASKDDSAGIASSRPGIEVLRSAENKGLAAASRMGAAVAGGSSLLLLNPDVIVREGSLASLSAFASSHPSAGVLGPSLLGTDGSIQSTARTFPSLASIAGRRTFLGRLPALGRAVDAHLHPVAPEAPGTSDWLSGAALWLPPRGRALLAGFSPRYFLYFEDVDLCWRCWESGLEVWYVPSSVMVHLCRRESAGRPGKALWLHLRSMLRFFADHPQAAFGHARRRA
jgi:N-acetylglucosaminyl-diphospho-decaprenol L-rhamnosyltransferase